MKPRRIRAHWLTAIAARGVCLGMLFATTPLATAPPATAAAPATVAARPPPVVDVNGATLVGAYDAELPQVASFKGVPFAAPPVGELRWREPQPVVARSGRVDATAFAAGCYQDSYNIDWYRRVGRAFGASPEAFQNPRFDEDCLYLNVWTPWLKSDARRPVMVWI